MSERIKTSLLWLVISVISFVSSILLLNYVDGYMEENAYRDVSGIVYDKFGKEKTHYKSTRIYTDFIIVIEDCDTGRYFDLSVSPTTFSRYEIGDKICFNHLSKSIIGEEFDSKDGLIIIAVVIALIGIVTFSFCLTEFFS